MRPLHVLQVIRPMQGGMRRHVLDLIDGLLEKGHQVSVACPAETSIARELRARVPTFPLELTDGVTPVADLKAVRHLQALFVRERFDLVHLHGAKAGYVGRLAVRQTAAHHRPGVVYTVHNQVLPRGGLLGQVMNVLERRLAAQTDRVITVSQRLQEEIIRRHRFEPALTVTIHNGIDPVAFLPREHARAILGCESESRILIGAIGRMVPEKGFDTLLDAFTLLISRGCDAELVLIGDGPHLSDYQNRAGKIGLARVRFLGHVPNAARLLKGLDLLVQPSHAEGLGLAAIEAMLAELAVVATAVGGLPEVVQHGETGLLVPPRDSEALADAIELLIEREEWRLELGANGKRRGEEQFSRQAMLQAILREYDAVCENRQGVRR